jgi:hypothetical protein
MKGDKSYLKKSSGMEPWTVLKYLEIMLKLMEKIGDGYLFDSNFQ